MSGTRDRILAATIELFRRHGYNGTSVKQVTLAAGVPFGSLYHFFPEGKEELAEAAIVESGRAYPLLFEEIYDAAASPADAIADFFDGAAQALEETGYLDLCPIGTVAGEVASTSERLRAATAAVFTDWIGAAAVRLEAAGVESDQAEALAVALVAALEGAFVLSRAAQSPEPMRVTGRIMRGVVGAAVGSRPERGRARERGSARPAPARVSPRR